MYGPPFRALRLSVIKMLLPTELIDRIFSFLQGDTSALKACLSAHPVYSKLAERYLYADLQISPSAVSGLHEQISKNPHLLDYPRTLQFSFDESARSITMMSMIPRMSKLPISSLSHSVDIQCGTSCTRVFSLRSKTASSNQPFRKFASLIFPVFHYLSSTTAGISGS